MSKFIRSVLAEQDLWEIWSYIAADNPSAADKLIINFATTCEFLAENPKAGRLRSELTEGMRSFPVGRYVIFYRPMAGGIVVARVLHGMRDLPELL